MAWLDLFENKQGFVSSIYLYPDQDPSGFQSDNGLVASIARWGIELTIILDTEQLVVRGDTVIFMLEHLVTETFLADCGVACLVVAHGGIAPVLPASETEMFRQDGKDVFRQDGSAT